MKIAYIFREDWEPDYIRSQLPEHEFCFISNLDELSPEDRSSVEALSLFIKTKLPAETLNQLPNLKLIAVRATGFDHVDLDYCRNNNITVCNVPTYGSHTVAEFAFALLLTLSRKTFEGYKQILETGKFTQTGLRGFDLYGKHLGVVGTGKIGLNVIRIARGFGMQVTAYDPFPRVELQAELGFEYASLEELLSRVDIVTLHAPYNEHTHHLINQSNIELLKPGTYLINTARGGLLETRALIKALESGRLAGAALDVLEEEGAVGEEIGLIESDHPQAETMRTMLSNHYLIDHPRVLITPHNAFNTEEAIKRILDTTIDNIKNFLAEEPSNTV